MRFGVRSRLDRLSPNIATLMMIVTRLGKRMATLEDLTQAVADVKAVICGAQDRIAADV
ncbi:hypothetical protein Ais01nite_21830 [Asanoa ishikariensis]|nr:hypothetical protein Ais01nite_21830 [Asanoa ishikariensis]